MKRRKVVIDIRERDGRPGHRSHTFWETRFGPVIGGAWSSKRAYALRDITYNFRGLNQQLAMNEAQSIAEMDAAGRRFLGIGWLNTVAVDTN